MNKNSARVSNIPLSRAEKALIADAKRSEDRWVKSIAGLRFAAGDALKMPYYRASSVLVSLVATAVAWAQTSLRLPRDGALGNGSLLANYREKMRAAFALPQVKFGLCGAALACAGVVALPVYGYFKHNDAFYHDRIAALTLNPILDADRQLIGAIGLDKNAPQDQLAELGFIPLQDAAPQIFIDTLVHLENRHFFDAGWRNICGLDPVSLVKIAATAFSSGRSGISQMTTKQLMATGNEANPAEKGFRYLTQIGQSCRLHRAITKSGGAVAYMRLAASYLPMAKGQGVTRGLEASARTLFDKTPNELSPGQQMLLAAAVRRPIPLLASDQDLKIPCAMLLKSNAQFDSAMAKAYRDRTLQCITINRAKFVAPSIVKSEPDLMAALDELNIFEATGIKLANPFKKIPAKRLINLTSRTASLLSDGVLNGIRAQAEEQILDSGAPIHVSINGVVQLDFQQKFSVALKDIQRSAAGLADLCMPLVATTPLDRMRPCGVPQEGSVADSLAVAVDASSGEVKSFFSSRPLLLDAEVPMASIGKLVVAYAAVKMDIGADEMLCPKAAFDGNRKLKRVTFPQFGFANCDDGKNAMSFATAMQYSDNLAIYELAKKVGRQGLSDAATVLGVGQPNAEKNIEYALAFGAYLATPAQMIAAMQLLSAAAHRIPVSSVAPQFLLTKMHTADQAKSLILTEPQPKSLATLLAAPLQPLGTMSALSPYAAGAKSGTTPAPQIWRGDSRYAMTKISVAYVPASNRIIFLMVSAPKSVPLGVPNLRQKLFLPLHLLMINPKGSI